MALNLPPYYRFDPIDEELMLYLYNKVHGLQLPSSAVLNCDLYGESQAWKGLFDETGENTLYFFTKLKKVGPSRIARATDSGTWRSQHDREIYMAGSSGNTQHVGYKRTFTFVPNKKDEEKGRWVMHEYRLHEGLLPACSTNPFDHYVLCRIKRKTTREERLKRKWIENYGAGTTGENSEANADMCLTVEELEALMHSDPADEQE